MLLCSSSVPFLPLCTATYNLLSACLHPAHTCCQQLPSTWQWHLMHKHGISGMQQALHPPCPSLTSCHATAWRIFGLKQSITLSSPSLSLSSLLFLLPPPLYSSHLVSSSLDTSHHHLSLPPPSLGWVVGGWEWDMDVAGRLQPAMPACNSHPAGLLG